jgi:hypothetical protein
MAIKRNVTNAEMKWERNSTLLVLIHRVVGSRAVRKKKRLLVSGLKSTVYPDEVLSSVTCAYKQQSFVPCSRAIYKPTLGPFSHTHTSLSHDDETAWRKLQSRWHLLCLYSRFFYPFNTTKVAQELFVQDLLNLQILDDCIYSRRFEGLSLFALCKKLRWMSTRDYVSRKAIQI